MAKTYHCRPSELLHIDHATQAFHLDRAVWIFGTSFDSDLREVEKPKGKGKQPSPADIERKRAQRLQKWLDDESTPQKPQRFRDPNITG